MHSALLVSELLSIIFQHLQDLDLRTLAPTSKTSLARCARTCQAWKEPALRIIWESLDSLLPLLKLFPLDAFSSGSKRNPGLWRFKRTLRPRDWDAFSRYTPLVRSFTFWEGKEIDGASLIALDIQRPLRYRYSPFLPNVVAIRWNANTGSAITLGSVLASPSLRKISICVTGSETSEAEKNDTICGLLCTLTEIAPNLTDVQLNISQLWKVSDIVSSLTGLQELESLSLDVGSIAPFLLRGLSSHPTLTKLRLDLCVLEDSFLRYLADFKPVAGDFLALKEVSIAADMTIVNAVLSLVILTPLHRLDITTYSPINPDDLSQCLRHLSRVSPDLRELRVTSSFDHNRISLIRKMANNADKYLLTAGHLMPWLNSFKQMEHLSIHLGYPMALDDSEVVLLITGLSSIEEFVLCPAPEWVQYKWKPKTTLRCLEYISLHIKRLRYLGISIDSTMIPRSIPPQPQEQMEIVQDIFKSPPTPPLTPESSAVLADSFPSSQGSQMQISQLQTLFVGVSPIEVGKGQEMKARLRELFPALRHVRPSDPPARGFRVGIEDGIKDEWERVSPALRPEGTSRAMQFSSVEPLDVGMDMDICDTEVGDGDGVDDEEWGLVFQGSV